MAKTISFMLTILIVLLSGTLASADEITVVADEWPPYNCRPDSDKPGYGIEIVKQIFEEAGHTIVYKTQPWSRAIVESRAGRYTAIIGATKKETPDFIFPEEEIGISYNSFFVSKKSTWRYNGLGSLRTVKIGVIKNYSYGKKLDRFLKENDQNIQYVYGEDPLLLNIKKLLAGRIDVLVEDSNVLLHKALEIGVTDQIVNAGSAMEPNLVYIAFSPQFPASAQYAALFTKGIRMLKASGKLEKILSAYGLAYWK